MRRILSLALLAVSLLCGQSLRVTGGVADDQVFQRDAQGRATIHLAGVAQGADGRSVEARLSRKHQVVRDWAPLGKVAGGKWAGELSDVPAGGPYRIDLRAGEGAAAVQNVLIGDLWVLAGQSNMQGVGDLTNVELPHELVHLFDMADRWMVAEEPLHTLVSAADRVHWPRNAEKQPERYEGERLKQYMATRRKGAGLGLPFAVEMVRRTGVPVGLLACAHGGTSMAQWDPALKDQGGDSLYGSMLRRVEAAGGKVAGVLWYQGESDANPKAAPVFQEKFEQFVRSVREDFGMPDLPFYYVQIGRHVSGQNVAEWNLVQESQRKAEAAMPRSGMAPAVDLALDDGIHVGTQDLKRLGRRLANLALDRTRRGPRPLAATFQNGMVRVSFEQVNGRLVTAGRVSGFSVHGADGAALPLIFKAEIDPADPTAVLLHIGGKLPEGASLRYGFGKDPYCNVRDAEDMAVPVFGPLPIR
jgi:sialate O-acetylesterase